MSTAAPSEPVYCSAGIKILGAPKLEDEGWEQRTVSDPNRMEELEDLYESLGFETKITSLDPLSFGQACNECAIGACSSYVALFTRKRD